MIKDKVVVITGASSGLGEATALRLAKQSAKLVLAARRQDRLEKIAKQVSAAGGESLVVETDVTDEKAVNQLAKQAIDKFGRIDVWINNAGLMPLSEFAKGRVDEWDRMIDVNLKGTLYGVNAALPQMRKQKSGQIINIASVAAHNAGAGSGVYSATKFGQWAASEALRQEEAMAKSNIRVTVVSPGSMATELADHIGDPEQAKATKEYSKANAIQPDDVARTIEFAIDLPEEVTANEIVVRPTRQVM